MHIKDQLTPLPQARRLDELGFKGESYYWHNHYYKTGEEVAWDGSKPYISMDFWDVEDGQIRDGESFPAYSVPELMDALPSWVTYKGEDYQIAVFKDGMGEKNICCHYALGDKTAVQVWSTNLAEALSDMIIRLIENGLYVVTSEE